LLCHKGGIHDDRRLEGKKERRNKNRSSEAMRRVLEVTDEERKAETSSPCVYFFDIPVADPSRFSVLALENPHIPTLNAN
jgi:hypothetical protein